MTRQSIKPNAPYQDPSSAQSIESPPRRSIPMWIVGVIVLLCIVIVGLTVMIGYQRMYPFQPGLQTAPLPISQPSSSSRTLRQTMKPDASWLTYTDAAAGFTLKYPPMVNLNGAEETGKQDLNIIVEKITDIPEELPLGMDRKTAMADKDALEAGKAQTIGDFASSDALVPLSGGSAAPNLTVNARMNSILSRFEICSVIFSRKVTFYPGEYRVIVSLSGDERSITESMPEFFTVDAKNCGEQKMWVRSEEKMGQFLPTLAKGEGKGAGQEWYDTFDGIIQTIILTSSEAAPSPLSSLTPTSIQACDVSDPAFCNVLTDIKQSMNTNNYNGVVAYQNTTTVTCDPDGMAIAICEGAPKGAVKEGYSVGYNQSEGSVRTRDQHVASLASYVAENGPFIYKGSLQQGDKGVIVYLNQDQSYLFVLYLKRTGLTWRFDAILVGGVFGDARYTALDPSLLEW